LDAIPLKAHLYIFIFFITGQVIEGQSALDNFYKGYGDIPPFGKGPDQQEIYRQGNKYIRENFPLTDFIQSCQIIDPAAAAAEEEARIRAAVEEREAAELAAAQQESRERESEGEGMSEGRDNDNDAVLDNTPEDMPQREVQIICCEIVPCADYMHTMCALSLCR
jgi:hypothetical protein